MGANPEFHLSLSVNATDPDELNRLIEFLPQKPPSRFLDRVTELVPGSRVRGEVDFPAGHRVFDNHLPGEPLVPGVILIEALAQVAGLALVPGDAPRGIHGYLGEVRHMRFRRQVLPDTTVQLEASLVQSFGHTHRFEVEASVEGKVVASGEVIVVGQIV